MATKKITSTDDFDPKKFRPHGRVNFIKDDDIMICEAKGPFDVELIEAVAYARNIAYEEMNDCEKWGTIVVIKESAVASEICIDLLIAYLSNLGKANLRSHVTSMVIADDVEGAEVMSARFISAYADAAQTLTVFNRLNDAKVFVKLHL